MSLCVSSGLVLVRDLLTLILYTGPHSTSLCRPPMNKGHRAEDVSIYQCLRSLHSLNRGSKVFRTCHEVNFFGGAGRGMTTIH